LGNTPFAARQITGDGPESGGKAHLMAGDTQNGNAMTLQRLVDDLRVVVRDGEALLKERLGQLEQQVRAHAQAADANIRRNPYPGMVVVFGLGFVAGILARELIFTKQDDA
jgi:ElaB/YqjD/DUF883 family membrane-anchored ribosome-binding protein